MPYFLLLQCTQSVPQTPELQGEQCHCSVACAGEAGGAKRGDIAEPPLPPPPPSVKTMFQAVAEPWTTCRILGGVMAEDVS
jgi:hypothetical protein